MRRNKPLVRNKNINKISKKTKDSLALYTEKRSLDHEQQVCFVCKTENHKSNMEPHHPKRRLGDNLMYYKYVCQECHRWIHENGKKAKELGYLE